MRTPTLEKNHPLGKVNDGDCQRIYRFTNGWGASVVRFPGSYGYENGYWELAVIKFFGENINEWHLNYNHPESHGDVRGHLTEEMVDNILYNIEHTGE